MDINVLQTLIVGHLWQSVALTAVLAGALILGKRMRGSTRYDLAAVAFVASLTLPLAAFVPGEALVTGLLDKLNAPATIAETAKAQPKPPTLLQSMAAQNNVPDWIGNLSAGVVKTAMPDGVAASDTFWGKAAIEDGAPVWAINLGGNALRAAVAEPAPPAPAPMFTFPEIKLPDFNLQGLNLPDLTLPIGLVWLAGVAVMLVRIGRDLVAVERLVARAKPADLPEALKRRMKGVRVAISSEAPGPMAAGLFRPCIVLPENIALNSPGMAALLEHERAHIERQDMLAALGQRLVLALMWWSPALYWISRRVDEEREVACDEQAVDRTGDAKAFARSLTIEAQNQLWARAPRLAVGAIGPRSQVGRRIKRLIEMAKGASPAKYAGRLAFAGLALAVAVAAMITPRFAADAQQANKSESIDLLAQDARDRARDEELAGPRSNDQEDRASRLAEIRRLNGDQDYDTLGKELSALMESLGDELDLAFADLSPELEAELGALSADMSALGVEIGLAVSDDVMANMPEIMEQVRQELAAEGIDIDDLDDIQQLTDEDRAEIQQALQEARDEIREKLGPEMREEIRRAMEEARAEVAGHKEEIRAAMEQRKAGIEIARAAMAKARAEIDAARARGDFDKLDEDKLDGDHSFNFDFGRDIEKQVFEQLKANGINVDRTVRIRDGRDDDASPASRLMRAANRCNDEEVRRLITEEKADVNTKIVGDGTPLIMAARKGCLDTVRVLLDAGANANIASPGDGNPLIVAAYRDHEDVAKLLIDRGANVNGASPGDGNPLIAAAQRGHLSMAKLLIDRGANVNAYVEGDETPLMAAAEQDELAIVKLLVDRGAKVNLAYNVKHQWNSSDKTELRSPLNMAERHGNDAVAKYLRSKGATSTPKAAN